MKQALLFSLILLVSCGGSGGGGTGTVTTPSNEDASDGTGSTYAVTSQSDLPTCSSSLEDQMYYVTSEYKWYECSSSSWTNVLSYDIITDVSNVNEVSTDYDELASASFYIQQGALTEYLSGGITLSITTRKLYASGGDSDTDYNSVSYYIPNGATFKPILGLIWRNAAAGLVEVYAYYDGTSVYLYADDGNSTLDPAEDELLQTLTWTSIISS